MLSMQDRRALAREMQAAQDEVRQIETITSRMPGFGLEDAYAVAGLIHAGRVAQGARPVGRKIGFTNPEMWERYAVREPVWGHVYAHGLVQAQGGQVCCSLARFAEPKIEPEIVFGLRAAPPAGGSAAEVLACVEWVAQGFEIVQSHYPGWRFRAPDTVADQGLHGMLLLGEPQPVEALGAGLAEALASFTLALSCDGAPRDSGLGANVLGSPLLAVAHLLRVLESQPQCAPLGAGEIVTTGTVTMAHPVQAGETWRSECEGIGLPALSVRFEP